MLTTAQSINTRRAVAKTVIITKGDMLKSESRGCISGKCTICRKKSGTMGQAQKGRERTAGFDLQESDRVPGALSFLFRAIFASETM
jgi:hypothetical protein